MLTVAETANLCQRVILSFVFSNIYRNKWMQLWVCAETSAGSYIWAVNYNQHSCTQRETKEQMAYTSFSLILLQTNMQQSLFFKPKKCKMSSRNDWLETWHQEGKSTVKYLIDERTKCLPLEQGLNKIVAGKNPAPADHSLSSNTCWGFDCTQLFLPAVFLLPPCSAYVPFWQTSCNRDETSQLRISPTLYTQIAYVYIHGWDRVKVWILEGGK